MFKLLPRFFAVLLAIGCCSQSWGQLTIDPACPNETVQCLAELYDVECASDPVIYHTEDDEMVPCGDVACTLVREIEENKQVCIASTAIPNNGTDAGALVLYNIANIDGVSSTYYVPTAPGSLQLHRYAESGTAILSGTVQGVTDASEQWEVFIVYEGQTTDSAHVADGGGLKYDPDCAPVDPESVDWDIYYMNNSMSYLMGAGSLSGSLLSLSHAPYNQFFGFQVGEKANDRNCNYGAGGWFSWEGTILGEPAAGAMGDVLVDLSCSQADYNPCEARVTCVCIGTDDVANVFEVFECVTQRHDDTPPTFDNAPANLVLDCPQALPEVPEVTATDNCEPGDLEMIDAVYQGQATVYDTAPGCYQVERTWTATDACNNTATYTQTITVQDTIAPTWDAYATYVMVDCMTMMTLEEAQDPTISPITASDACDDTLDYVVMATELSGGCPRTWLRTWRATDDCGNHSEYTEQYVQLYDETDPTVTAPADTLVYLDGDCNYDASPSITGYPELYDACTSDELLLTNRDYSDSLSASTCDGDDDMPEGSFTITRTWSTTDYCLNDGSDTQTIEVLDHIAPEGEVHDVTLDCGAFDCEAEYTQNGAPSATDNCDSDVANSWVNLHCVTFHFTMDYWVPIEGMVILSESGETVSEGDFSEFAGSVDWVNGGEVSTTLMLEPGAYNIELTDSYGDGWAWNSVDGTDALVITYETLEMESAIAIDFTDGYSVSEDFDLDACGSRCGPVADEEFCYYRQRKYTFVDDCGNSSTEIQTIFLEDNAAPTFDGDNNVQLACDLYNEDDNFGGVLGLTNVTDNCAHDDDITITFTDVEMSAGCAGMYTRTYTISDECGNSANFTQYVTLTDNEAPTFTITCPATADIYVDGYCTVDDSSSVTGEPTVHDLMDNCDGNIFVSKTYADGEPTGVCPGEYTFTRTWTVMALDHCYNFTTQTCTQTINVHDDLAPSAPGMVCPADADLYLDDECSVDSSTEVTGEATAASADNCQLDTVNVWHEDGPNTYTCEPDAAGAFSLTASLEALGTASATLEEDLVAVGAHIDLDWSSLGCTEWPSDLTLEITSPDGQCLVISGFTATEPNADCEQHSYPDSWNTTMPGNFILDLEFDAPLSGSGTWTLEATENWDGACGVDIDLELTLLRRAEGDYKFTRTWYAQAFDCVGNASAISSCDQLISVHDTIAPEFDLEATAHQYEIACDLYDESAVYEVFADDNCDSNVKIEVLYNEDCDGDLEHGFDNAEVSGSCGGAYIRTYLATDDCGNTSTFEQYIMLTDTEDPVVTLDCPADITISKDDDCFANDTRSGAGEATYEVTDNCSVDSTCVHVTDSEPTAICAHSYSFTRTWEVEAWDDCGNHSSATCSQEITVQDDSAPGKPAIDCPGTVTLHRDSACYADISTENTGMLSIVYSEGYDNCSADSLLTEMISYTDTAIGNTDCTHYIERTWTAYLIDECGNASEANTCTQIINLIDDIDPMIHLDATVYVDCEVFHANPDSIFATASDNCDPNVALELISQDMIMPGTCAGLYQNTYRATDCSGNQYTTSHLVDLVDDTAPTFLTFPADTIVECGAGTTPEDLGTPTYDDECAASEDVEIDYTDLVSTFKGDDCQTIERHWTITDPCGNSHTAIQTFEIEDTGYPVITTPACDHTFQCDGEGNMDQFNTWLDTHAGAAATDECSSIIWDYEVPVVSAGPNPMLSDGCGGTGEVTVTFYAIDACGNSTPTTATFTLVDTLAPDLTNVVLPDDATLSQTANCDRSTGVNITGVPSADADNGEDACCYAFVDISHEDGAISCLCEPDDDQWFVPQFSEEELWTYCETEAEISGVVSFDWDYNTEDVDGAEFDVAVYVNGQLSDLMGADEQSGSISIEVGAGETIGFGIVSMDGLYGGASLLISNFSGPSGMDFIGIYDEANWDQYDGFNGSHTFSNDGETLLIEGTNVDLVCEGSYKFTRTWTLYAFDECGNQSEAVTHEQLITVLDEIKPQFTETCGIGNTDEIDVDYADACGEIDIPAACDVAADDNCDADVAITHTMTITGQYAPLGDVDNYCLATTPAAYANNETCNSMAPHALRLIGLPGDDSFYTMDGDALVTEYNSGEIMLTCSLSSTVVPNAGWILHLSLLTEQNVIDAIDDGADASEFCLNSTNFLGEIADLISCSNVMAEIGEADFKKYIVDCRAGDDGQPKSRLVGINSYGGSQLNLSHQPSNSYYAFQIGFGANQQNAEFGMSGWFFWEGHFLSQNVMGSGDFFCDLDCTLPYTIEHCYVAVDDCGNAETFCYKLNITGEVASEDDAEAGGIDAGNGDHTPVVIGGAGDVTTGKTPIRVTNLQPNPTNDVSQLGFVVSENMRIRVDLVGMDGALVAELYDGVATSGVNHTLDVDAQGLSGGMYQIRLASSDYLVVKKLLVSE